MSLLNKAQLRRYILEYAGKARYHKFTRVAPSVYQAAEAKMIEFCRSLVDRHPTKGKTISTL